MIATILILEHACLFNGSQPKSTRDEALDRAHSRYVSSGIHNTVTKQFSGSPTQYSVLDLTEFILKHRLQ